MLLGANGSEESCKQRLEVGTAHGNLYGEEHELWCWVFNGDKSTQRPKTKEGRRERTLPSTDPLPLPPLKDIILKIYFISQLHYGTTKSCESNLRTDYLLTYFI